MKKKNILLALALIFVATIPTLACDGFYFICGDVTLRDLIADASQNCEGTTSISWMDCDGNSGHEYVR